MKYLFLRLILGVLLSAAVMGLLLVPIFHMADERSEELKEKYEEKYDSGVEDTSYSDMFIYSYYIGMAMGARKDAYSRAPKDYDQSYEMGYNLAYDFRSSWAYGIYALDRSALADGFFAAYKTATGRDKMPDNIDAFMQGCFDGFVDQSELKYYEYE